MAEEQQDKTEHKSQKKLKEARDKGELPHSKEIATFALFTYVILYFYIVNIDWFYAFGEVMSEFLSFDRHLDLNLESLKSFLVRPIIKSALILLPFFGGIFVLSVFVNMAQTGFNIAKERLRVDWERLDPSKGIKKIVSLKQVVEGAKSTLKISLFILLVYLVVEKEWAKIVNLPGQDLPSQLRFLMSLSLDIGVRVAILMAILAAGDFLFQWHQFQQKLRMTHRELKDETKEHEGDPLVRQRLRSIRMQMARERMMNQVPKADVVITNPTHYAVAIAYDADKAPAPYVCAKGKQHLAARIRELAMERGIPIVENPPMARALYKRVKIGQVVPSDFFRAVAELLAFIYLLRKRGDAAWRFRRPLKPRLKAPIPAERGR